MVCRKDFEAIGTHWCIDLPEALDAQRVECVLKKIHDRIEEFDRAYSRFRVDSIVTQMSQQSGRFVFPADSASMMTFYRRLYDLTDGAVTPLIGNVLSDSGYDAAYSLQQKSMMVPKAWDEVIRFHGESIETSEPVLFDFGAAGKGYIVDIISDLIEAEGINSYCVDAGGDMRYRSVVDEPLRVGLEHPIDTKQVIGVASIVNRSICGSAMNRRAWGDFHHVIDPRTLTSPKHVLAVWVVAETTMIADGLTTALMFATPHVLLQEFDFEYAIVHADLSLSVSSSFPAEFFVT